VNEILKQAATFDTTTPGLAAFKLTLKAITIFTFQKKLTTNIEKHKC
jgi:hypothetical protein